MNTDSTEKISYLSLSANEIRPLEKPVVRETAWTIYVNGQELVTILCTPDKMSCLVLGFLASEGIIQSLDDVALLRICEDEGNLADVRLKNESLSLPRKQVLLSGCGGGVTFNDLSASRTPLDSSLSISPSQILKLMRLLYQEAEAYRAAGGIHASALSNGESLLVVAEDVGRHNTLDKIRGECMLKGIPTKERIILTTGRISSEMVNKAVGMETPILISRTSPTDLAVRLADSWGITLVGYAREKRIDCRHWSNQRAGQHAMSPCRSVLVRSNATLSVYLCAGAIPDCYGPQWLGVFCEDV